MSEPWTEQYWREIGEKARTMDDFSRWTSHDFGIAIAEVYFPAHDEASKEDVRIKIRNCCDNLVSAVLASRPIKDNLKRAVSDLEYLAEALLPGKRPRRSITISGATLSLIGGVMPSALKPNAQGGDQYEDFGGIVGSVFDGSFLDDENDPNDIPMEAAFRATLAIPASSERLRGLAHLHSAADAMLGFDHAHQDLSAWPACLSELGYEKRQEISHEATMAQIITLSTDLREQLVTLAKKTLLWVCLQFGIESRNDPLRINPATLQYGNLSAVLVKNLLELVNPFPDCLEIPRYEIIKAYPSHRGLYAVCVRHVRSLVSSYSEVECSPDTLRFAGLFPSDPAEDDECNRFIDRMIATHRQIALLNKARTCAAELLADVGVDMADFSVNVPGTPFGVCWSDYHELGRWTDSLRGRLRLGMVDPGRDKSRRIAVPEHRSWNFPAHLRCDHSPERLIADLLPAARKAKLIRNQQANRNRA